MLQNNESGLHGRDLCQPGLKGINDRLSGSSLGRDVPIVGIKVLGPDGSLEAELGGNGTDTVVDVSEGRSPIDGSDTDDGFDGFLGPFEFSDDLSVGEGGHG